ncbi:unnamed protein product [Pleuronectes platessa]|uniref:Uncharacterized protein n=1 Tax=Pleuronectes platessa TaxID=8262 RepID=A0A9N7VQ90_PLEPL|nr:unnamed protein product [Pleuronectes platessa]
MSHSSSNTALISDWMSGGVFRTEASESPAPPFCCADNPRAVRTERGRNEDEAKDIRNDSWTDSKINDPYTRSAGEQRCFLIRRPGPLRHLAAIHVNRKSCRFQWPINERPRRTTPSLTPSVPRAALHPENLILMGERVERKARANPRARAWLQFMSGAEPPLMGHGNLQAPLCAVNSAELIKANAEYTAAVVHQSLKHFSLAVNAPR